MRIAKKPRKFDFRWRSNRLRRSPSPARSKSMSRLSRGLCGRLEMRTKVSKRLEILVKDWG